MSTASGAVAPRSLCVSSLRGSRRKSPLLRDRSDSPHRVAPPELCEPNGSCGVGVGSWDRCSDFLHGCRSLSVGCWVSSARVYFTRKSLVSFIPIIKCMSTEFWETVCSLSLPLFGVQDTSLPSPSPYFLPIRSATRLPPWVSDSQLLSLFMFYWFSGMLLYNAAV